MSKRARVETVLLVIVFVCYIVLLLKVLFLSRVPFLELFNMQRASVYSRRMLNLIPFHSIASYLRYATFGLAFGNIAGNVAVFVPLGLYLTLFKKDKRVGTNLLIIFLVSLSAEIIQYIFAIGSSDIDDIILNCVGGLIGILMYKLFLRVCNSEKRVHTAITVLSVIVGLPVIFYLLFVMRMNF